MNLEERSGLHAERAAEKQAEREQDWRDVAAGRRSAAQVNGDNSLARGLMDRFQMRPGFGVR